jgi:hypothetical protein
MTKTELNDYCGSTGYHNNLSTGLSPLTKTAAIFKSETTELTASEFRRGVKRDKSHYMELKDDKYFNSWNHSFVATAFMHHKQHVLDADYKPVTATEIGLFKFSRKCKSLCTLSSKTSSKPTKVNSWSTTTKLHVMPNESTRNLPSMPQAPQWHRFFGDTLLKYFTSARLLSNWRGTAYAFVFIIEIQA